MDPFLSALVETGVITLEEAEILSEQFDPEALLRRLQKRLLRSFQIALNAQRDRLIDSIVVNAGQLSQSQQDRIWKQEQPLLWSAVRVALLDIASEESVVAGLRVGDWQFVNQTVIAWAEDYYLDADDSAHGSILNLNLTSRRQFQEAFLAWQRGTLPAVGIEEGLPQLINAVEPIFGLRRAEEIAITETTRIHAQATLFAERANPFTTQWEWKTSFDDRVCPICSPLNGTRIVKDAAGFVIEGGATTYPPAHTRCKCRIIPLTEGSASVPVNPVWEVGRG